MRLDFVFCVLDRQMDCSFLCVGIWGTSLQKHENLFFNITLNQTAMVYSFVFAPTALYPHCTVAPPTLCYF